MKESSEYLKKIAQDEILKEAFDIKKQKVKSLLKDLDKAKLVVQSIEDELNAILSE